MENGIGSLSPSNNAPSAPTGETWSVRYEVALCMPFLVMCTLCLSAALTCKQPRLSHVQTAEARENSASRKAT